MKPRILVLNAHPRTGSLNDALAEHYSTGATQAGAHVDLVHVRDLNFDPILHGGYATPTPLEPDLIQFQQQLTACDHLVVVTPLWWNSLPAGIKGLIDRTFLPGFAFNYVEGKKLPVKLLGGRTARILITMDSPRIYQQLLAGDTAVRMLKRNVLSFCGFKPVRVNRFSPVHGASPEQLTKYLTNAKILGEKDGTRTVKPGKKMPTVTDPSTT